MDRVLSFPRREDFKAKVAQEALAEALSRDAKPERCAQACADGSNITTTIARIGPLRAKPQPRPVGKSEFQIWRSKPHLF